MERFIRRRDIPYILASIVLGSISHFLYDFSEHNPFTALITPVNESTWEHLKLLFFPVLFLSGIEYYLQRPKRGAFFTARFLGVVFGMLSIIGLFYGYSSLFGKDFLIADIFIFILSVFIVYFVTGKLYRKFFAVDAMLPFFAWFGTVLLFFIFTCYPPNFFLFFPPQ